MRPAWGLFGIVLVCLAWPAAAADRPLNVELWPGVVPDETGAIGAEKTLMSPQLDRKQVEVTESTRLVTNVSRPTITSAIRPRQGQRQRNRNPDLPGVDIGISIGNWGRGGGDWLRSLGSRESSLSTVCRGGRMSQKVNRPAARFRMPSVRSASSAAKPSSGESTRSGSA